MSQLSVYLTSDTETLLKKFMKTIHISNKSEAVRIAIQEATSARKKEGQLEKLSDMHIPNAVTEAALQEAAFGHNLKKLPLKN
jgi:hypothetical protein